MVAGVVSQLACGEENVPGDVCGDTGDEDDRDRDKGKSCSSYWATRLVRRYGHNESDAAYSEMGKNHQADSKESRRHDPERGVDGVYSPFEQGTLFKSDMLGADPPLVLTVWYAAATVLQVSNVGANVKAVWYVHDPGGTSHCETGCLGFFLLQLAEVEIFAMLHFLDTGYDLHTEDVTVEEVEASDIVGEMCILGGREPDDGKSCDGQVSETVDSSAEFNDVASKSVKIASRQGEGVELWLYRQESTAYVEESKRPVREEEHRQIKGVVGVPVYVEIWATFSFGEGCTSSASVRCDGEPAGSVVSGIHSALVAVPTYYGRVTSVRQVFASGVCVNVARYIYDPGGSFCHEGCVAIYSSN